MRRFGFNIAVSVAALLLAVMGVFAAVGFATLSLYLFLVSVVSPPLAALIASVSALLFALVVVGAAGLTWRRPTPTRREDESDILAGLSEALALGKKLGLEGRGFLISHLSRASIMLFAVGVAMGVSPKLRKMILNMIVGAAR